MATHSSILAWEILWKEDPGGLQSMVTKRVRHDLATEQQRMRRFSALLVVEEVEIRITGGKPPHV